MTTRPSTRRGPLLVGIAVLLAAGLAWLGSRADRAGEVPPGSAPGQAAGLGEEASTTAGAAAASLRGGRREPRRPGQTQEEADEEAIAYLRELFGATIDNGRTQIKAIEKLIGYLMEAYPDSWREKLREMLGRAFPDRAEELWGRFQAMEGYQEWLQANREDLGKMDRLARRDALRDARQRFFGEDAAEIWAETLRQDHIRDVMDTIDQTGGTTLEEKFGDYLNAIVDSYGEAADTFIERRQTELLQGFLGIPSVQEDLRALSPQARAPRLDEIRRGMGMDDEALQRWRDLDAQRDQAWANGEEYMEERARIVDGFAGEEQARRLDELRERYFRKEADIIRAEEDGGFFRYGHDRMIGNE